MSLGLSFSLAMRDYWHERLLSACAVLALAAVLAPLMVLLGVHHGIISSMTERLLNDPRTLEISPVGSGKYGHAWFSRLAELPQTAFVIPQTRSIAATVTLRDPVQPGLQAITPMTASDAGDSLLARWQAPGVGWRHAAGSDTPVADLVLSESSARKLNTTAGALLEVRVDRVRQGRRETAGLAARVLFVLPPEAHATDMAYVPLELLVAAEDYRDGRSVAFLRWEGDEPAASGPSPTGEGARLAPQELLHAYGQSIRKQREYASFRLYAKSLDDVAPLWRFFQEQKIEVYVKSAEIDTVKSLDRSFTIVFALITGAALFGFCASTASNALAGVRRKSRSLGIMRLIGFSRPGMLLFPMIQTMTTGVFGFLLAFMLYLGVAYSIDHLFAASLPVGGSICSLPPPYALAVFGAVIALAALSSLFAAWQATTIQPSEVIRDV